MRVLWREPRERSAGGWCRHMDRDFALVGDGGGVWSFIPTADAAEATVAAATHALGWQPRHPSWRQGLAT
jgi:hypothetical protein